MEYTAEKRIIEVQTFFENSDTVLGFRKLMDCAIDTQDLSIYKKVIELTDWKEKHPKQEPELIERSLLLLQEIAKIPIPHCERNNPVIKANDLIKSYGVNRFKLGPISVDIKKGQVYGLVGENGNGKTTLLRILAKELKFDSGSLDFRFDSHYYDDFGLRTNLVYIPQRTQRWYGSLKDNLKFVLSSYGVPPQENEIRVLMMIARFGLWNYKHLKWSELSSGYKMRFELARTMLRQPELLLLDEPLANLDVLAQQVILEDLKSICNSINNPIALILSSQQLYEVEKISDKVIYLKNGKYTDSNDTKIETQQLIVEIDCDLDRSSLEEVLEPNLLETLNYNGGIYVAYFNHKTKFPDILSSLGAHGVNATYVRNISKSTRRFFVS
ncbi:MAG: ABC transporter ATP-binding protein [Bacteroidota bacterium]